MKDFVFISDFDGTITAQDFYKQLLFRYEQDKIYNQYPKFLNGELNCLEFLSDIFKDINLTKQELDKEIKYIPLDPYFIETVNILYKNNIDVIILSAGCEYYIKRALKDKINFDIKIIAVKGVYKNKGIETIQDKDNIFYSPKWGIDKTQVVKYYKSQYKKIIYAGDSVPDYGGCKISDIRFAKGKLLELMEKEKIPCNRFINYKVIRDYIVEKIIK